MEYQWLFCHKFALTHLKHWLSSVLCSQWDLESLILERTPFGFLFTIFGTIVHRRRSTRAKRWCDSAITYTGTPNLTRSLSSELLRQSRFFLSTSWYYWRFRNWSVFRSIQSRIQSNWLNNKSRVNTRLGKQRSKCLKIDLQNRSYWIGGYSWECWQASATLSECWWG